MSIIDSKVDYFSRWLVVHSHKLALIIIPLLLLSASGIQKIQFSSELNDYIDYEDPSHIAYRALNNDYVPLRQLVYVIDFGDEQIYTKNNLILLENLTDAAYETPYASHVDSLTKAQYSYSIEDEYYQTPLFEDIGSLSLQRIKQRQKYANEDPLIVGRLVSHSGNVAGIYTTIDWPNGIHLPMLIETMNYAEQLKSDIEDQYPGVSIYLTGVTSHPIQGTSSRPNSGETAPKNKTLP